MGRRFSKTSNRVLASPGKYLVRIVDANYATSKAGNEMITVRLAIDNVPFTFSDWLVLIDSGCDKIADFLTAIGESVENFDLAPENLFGREALARVGVEKYGERWYNKIDKWLPPTQNADAKTTADVHNEQ